MATLKVYRTPIGFHDAYVAAPSQKAALRAWGSDADLFARGIAEVVTDPALTAEPLARPGEVVKRSRGTAEQLAALPPDRAKATPPAKSKTSARAGPPKPKRDEVDAAEQAVGDAEQRHATEARALAAEEEALAKRRRDMRARHEAESDELAATRRTADAAYAKALGAWRDAG